MTTPSVPDADPTRVRAALRAAAGTGQFFALDTHLTGDGWRPIAELHESGLDGLVGRAARPDVGGPLAGAPPQVAASITHLGHAARLWSPVLGAALLGSVVPDLTGLRYRRAEPGDRIVLALPDPRGWAVPRPPHHEDPARPGTPADPTRTGRIASSADPGASAAPARPGTPANPVRTGRLGPSAGPGALDAPARPGILADPADVGELAALCYRVVVDGQLEPQARALAGRLAAGLLWGNAASAMIGALGVLARTRPERAGLAQAVATALLGTGRLRGTGQLGVSAAALGFRRRSCCLYYRLPGGGVCGDCCFSEPPRAARSA